ncbi:MAG: type II toxin-antitoxin system HicA family toxin [Bacteroidota bacterium]|nr:type II toxin-antitoxin system HicA family toxin [Bacteroidota bacterium]
MGNFRPLPTKCWESFLLMMGYRYSRTKGSQDIWIKKNAPRSIPVWGDEKEIPAQHLKSSCNTMGTTLDILYAWAQENC